jgi:hypothetical protein
MTRLRLFAAAMAVVLAGALGGSAFAVSSATGAAAVSHRHTGSLTTTVPCTSLGVADTCTLKVTSLDLVGRSVTANGTVSNSAGTITDVPFAAPLSVVDPCQVLDLTLGPLHLDLLGLVVDLNQVHLNITAQNGPGNLLGNLLCAVAHLLDNSGGGLGGALQNLVNSINQILANL